MKTKIVKYEQFNESLRDKMESPSNTKVKEGMTKLMSTLKQISEDPEGYPHDLFTMLQHIYDEDEDNKMLKDLADLGLNNNSSLMVYIIDSLDYMKDNESKLFKGYFMEKMYELIEKNIDKIDPSDFHPEIMEII